jgi:hypothetical protein
MDEGLRAWLEAAEGDDETFVETDFRIVLRSLRRRGGIPRSG